MKRVVALFLIILITKFGFNIEHDSILLLVKNFNKLPKIIVLSKYNFKKNLFEILQTECLLTLYLILDFIKTLLNVFFLKKLKVNIIPFKRKIDKKNNKFIKPKSYEYFFFIFKGLWLGYI